MTILLFAGNEYQILGGEVPRSHHISAVPKRKFLKNLYYSIFKEEFKLFRVTYYELFNKRVGRYLGRSISPPTKVIHLKTLRWLI